jgi:hypothetical protein
MNRKLIAGAAAALLIPASFGVVSAGAKKAAAKPSISSVTFTNLNTYTNSWGGGNAGGSGTSSYTAQPNTSLSPYEEATMTITGSNLGTSTSPTQVSFTDKTKAIIGLLAPGTCAMATSPVARLLSARVASASRRVR